MARQRILLLHGFEAIKQILADQIKSGMVQERRTKAPMAIRMQTSRRALDRLLDRQIRVLLCTLCNAPLRPSAANCGWN